MSVFEKLTIAALTPVLQLFDFARDRRLKASLGHCGENVVIRQPSVIEVPENVFIEDRVGIASFLHIWGNARVTIGARTMIGSHVAITTGTHDPDALVMRDTLIEQPVVIEHDVWIGTHAVIMPGVTIGAYSVVAAGSVVRTDIAPGCIVAGVPAKIVRQKNLLEGGNQIAVAE
jgi:acetyltransferase-like isoleucine patch superfamily enzyme